MEEKYQLKRPETFKTRKRLGCGIGSRGGNKCGRGQDGQRSRSGSKRRAWFEGGQMPLQRRVPKRGFNNTNFSKFYQLVSVGQLEKCDVSEITPEILKEKNIIKNIESRIKILSSGEISKAVKVTVDGFSKAAEEKIKKAGGEIIIRDSIKKIKTESEPGK